MEKSRLREIISMAAGSRPSCIKKSWREELMEEIWLTKL